MGSELARFLRHRRLPPIHHKVALERSYPGSSCTLKCNVLTWRGVITPTALSRPYKVEIVYDGHYAPRITVCGESLRGLAKSDFPHKYAVDEERHRVRVCLYLPFELDYMKPFSETLVPWTAEWLLHYEIWLATGDWRGGGEHPAGGTKRPYVKSQSDILDKPQRIDK